MIRTGSPSSSWLDRSGEAPRKSSTVVRATISGARRRAKATRGVGAKTCTVSSGWGRTVTRRTRTLLTILVVLRLEDLAWRESAPRPLTVKPRLSCAAHAVCAVLDDGRAKCWGKTHTESSGSTLDRFLYVGNAVGEMGDALPFLYLGEGRRVLKLSGGYEHFGAVLDTCTAEVLGKELSRGDRCGARRIPHLGGCARHAVLRQRTGLDRRLGIGCVLPPASRRGRRGDDAFDVRGIRERSWVKCFVG